MSTMPQTAGLRLWPAFGRRRSVPRETEAQRLMIAEEQILRRAGELKAPRRRGRADTPERVVVAPPRWI